MEHRHLRLIGVVDQALGIAQRALAVRCSGILPLKYSFWKSMTSKALRDAWMV